MKRTLIQEKELVLKISSSYESKKFRIDKYLDFLDRLCWTREYQKEAIKNACIFLLWWRYENILSLAKENYNSNDKLQDKYKNIFSNFEKKLQLKDKLSCNIDLATWTWKSYVIYGIAQIMLCEWKIDKVLVLAPSITIREWLFSKFKSLSSNKELKDIINSIDWINYKNPKIIHASWTLEAWSICVENIHKTHKGNKSAIEDSVIWLWEKTLVLNDEAHHIFSKPNKEDLNLKKWYEFLSDKDYNFKYIVWFTWTPYIEDEYFTDVIYRYSILEWIEQKFIKKVDYVKDTDKSLDTDERMQIILQNHNENQKKYNKIKPITIFISKDINNCKKDRNKIIDFLHNEEWTKKEDLEKQVLIVTSHKDHKDNLDILKTVWNSKNPVQWICSVAMLTEGWDVPNVFQIVPSEEKAFNSKLLISQVIWRWLRIPEEYKWEDLSVTILNHTKFKEDINHLVDEILEVEEKIYSYPIIEKEKYNFTIYNIEYDDWQKEKEIENRDYFAPDFKKWFNLFADDEEVEREIILWTLWSDKEKVKTYLLQKETKTVEELTQEIVNKITAWCTELESDWVNEEEIEKLEKYDYNTIYKLIEKSLEKKWLNKDKITKANAEKILKGFWVIKRFWTKSIFYSKKAKWIEKLNIYDENGWLWKSWVSLSTVKNWKSFIFYDENSEKYSKDEDKEALALLDDTVWKKLFIEIKNSTLNKTPLNINIAWSWPERDFIKLLVDEKYIDVIDWFFKSKDNWFYDLEYSWRKWEHNVFLKFNPDFFIKSGKQILVIEIKWNESEKESSRDFIKNRAKYSQAKKHFELLNKELKEMWIEQKYYFHFCSPNDYKIFFKYLLKWNIDKYSSRLEAEYEDSLLKDVNLKTLDIHFDDKNLKEVFWINWNNLEDYSKIYLKTAEKNYFDNIDVENYNFSWWELTKAFELELRTKIFDRIRDDEDISYKIMEEEENNPKNNQKFKTLNYFNYEDEKLDLWTMQILLTFNENLINYIKDNFQDFDFEIWRNMNNYNLIQNKKFDNLSSEFYKDLPNTIWLIREKFRNADSHGWKVFKKEELEELRGIMLYWESILVKLEKIS